MDHFFQVGVKTKPNFFLFFLLSRNFMNFCWKNQFLGGSTLAPFIFAYLSPVTCLGRGSNLAPFIFFYLCAGGICLMDLSWQVIMVTWGCQCSLMWICVLILPVLHPCSQASTKWKTMKIASNRWTHKPKMKNHRNFLHMAVCDMCDMCYYIRFRFNCTSWRNTRSAPVTLERAAIMTDSATNVSINEWNGYNQFGWSFAMEREKHVIFLQRTAIWQVFFSAGSFFFTKPDFMVHLRILLLALSACLTWQAPSGFLPGGQRVPLCHPELLNGRANDWKW